MPLIRISLAAQRLTLEGAGRPFLARISSGAAGAGFAEGSGCTPTGRFCVCSKHGENAPLQTRFVGRIPVGIYEEGADGEDAILSRILCLEGLEEANANTRARYIYIHGTNDTEHLGQPVSHGCIRLSPAEMAELFEAVPLACPVEILP